MDGKVRVTLHQSVEGRQGPQAASLASMQDTLNRTRVAADPTSAASERNKGAPTLVPVWAPTNNTAGSCSAATVVRPFKATSCCTVEDSHTGGLEDGVTLRVAATDGVTEGELLGVDAADEEGVKAPSVAVE